MESRSESEDQCILPSHWGDFSDLPSSRSRPSTVSFVFKSSTGYTSDFSCYPLKYKRRRVMAKNGQLNILRKNFTNKHRRKFIQDIFYTMVDSKWRFTFIIFIIWYIFSWLLFAFIWLMISTVHGDLEEDHLPIVQSEFLAIFVRKQSLTLSICRTSFALSLRH